MALRTAKRAFGALLVLFALGWHSAVPAQPCEPVVGRFVSIEGTVELQRGGATSWVPASLNEPLCQQDTLRAGRHSRAAIALINDAILRLDEGTTLRLLNITGVAEEPSLLDLLRGVIKSFSRKPRLIKVTSPYLNGAIEGTEFQLQVLNDAATLTVLEGLVRAENPQGGVLVAAGQAATAMRGAAPQLRTLVRPRDAVQWTLYYPPVFAAPGGAASAAAEESPEFASALMSAARGNVGDAIVELERAPESIRGGRFYAFRAALLLSIGRVQAATADISRAIALAPNDGLAYALRSVLNVVSNRRAEALTDGQRAVDLTPSPAARVALSYAQQANFQLEAARNTLLAAVEAHPGNALAWARLGELHLMLGERRRASEAAATAKGLAPDLARTQLVLGYAALAQFRKTEARAAFERAIELSSADPLAHLGLGLTEISQGRLAKGRQRIEVAVGLDSSSALLRAYLGKAYFEEKRGPLDSEQYAIAKSLDPLDPTAYLYDAIAKQTTNRPVEALDDLEASIERNDNRAVYRGRLLLDEDRAARGTSLARVYGNLGFDRLGIKESAESLATDPTNASAHRFLSDTYRAQSRREIARVSELLQAQMLQDININPIQPSIASTSLSIVTSGGPTEAGFNEFTPLYEQNRGQLNVSGFLGDNHTRGGEAVLSGVFNNVSLSAGGFRFNSDGFRENNDLEHRIVDAYAQVALSPTVNFQAEFRRRLTETGDIFMNFDPDGFDPFRRVKDEEDVQRLGLRVSPSERSTLLLSAIFSDRNATRTSRTVLPPQPPVVGGETIELQPTDSDSEQYEALYTFRSERFNLITGGAYSRVELAESVFATTTLNIDLPPIAGRLCQLGLIVIPFPGPVCPPGFTDLGPIIIDPPPSTSTSSQSFNLDSNADDYRGYAYANAEVLPSLVATVGLGYTDFEDRFGEFERWTPKFGLQWDLTDALRLRGAYFKVVKPVLASNRLLEPTQVAGFNQFFDDGNATRSTRYGVGLDWRVLPDLYAGGELTRREIDHRNLDLTTTPFRAVFEDRDEYTHSAYLYWTPTDRLALSARAIYDKFNASVPSLTIPAKVTTRSFPFTATYFHPSGIFLEGTASYVRQDVRRGPNSTLAQGDSSFGVVGLGAGYRLPKRRGILSLSVENIFDRSMRYQDDSYRNFNQEPSGTPFVPERTVMGRVSLSLP
jgi:predicted Zn-dependent protease